MHGSKLILMRMERILFFLNFTKCDGREDTLLLMPVSSKAELKAKVGFSQLELDRAGVVGLPSKTAETTAQYSVSSHSVNSMTWMKVGKSR